MSFADAVSTCFQKYIVFDGRASRSEYWWWVLFTILISIPASVLDLLTGFGWLSNLLSLALFLPGLAVAFRRFHDIGKSGWWVFFPMAVALVGVVVILVAGVVGFAGVLGSSGEATGAALIIALLTGAVVLAVLVLQLVWLCTPSQPGPNQYGPNPFDEGPVGMPGYPAAPQYGTQGYGPGGYVNQMPPAAPPGYTQGGYPPPPPPGYDQGGYPPPPAGN